MEIDRILYGPLGRAVSVAMPGSEADPIGVYAAALSLWSSAISRTVTMGADRPVVVWTVLVGESALGGKGAALRTALQVLNSPLRQFVSSNSLTGISSGPSLVKALSELELRSERLEGGADGRAILIEEEWEESLARARRCTSFKTQLRKAWDGKGLKNKTTKEEHEVARPLLTLHAHITPAMWRVFMASGKEALGGQYNRLLPIRVELSKELPYNHKRNTSSSPELVAAYKWATERPRNMTLTREGGRYYDRLRAEIIAQLRQLPEGTSVYLQRSAEQVLRVAATLTAAESKTKISAAAVEAAWGFVSYSMACVKTLTAAVDSTRVRTPEDRVRALLEKGGGKVMRSDLLRGLQGIADAAALPGIIEAMPDVELWTDTARTGRGPKPVYARWAEAEASAEPRTLHVVTGSGATKKPRAAAAPRKPLPGQAFAHLI